MTKKDYIELADCIREHTANEYFTEEFEKHMGARLNPVLFLDDFLKDLCGILKRDNRAFDKLQFMYACKRRKS